MIDKKDPLQTSEGGAACIIHSLLSHRYFPYLSSIIFRHVFGAAKIYSNYRPLFSWLLLGEKTEEVPGPDEHDLCEMCKMHLHSMSLMCCVDAFCNLDLNSFQFYFSCNHFMCISGSA